MGFWIHTWEGAERLEVLQSQELIRVIHIEAKQKHIGELAKKNPSHGFKRLFRVLGEEAWLTESINRSGEEKQA